MSWKPKKWVAVVLALLVPPLSMLYVARLMYAVIYFAVGFSVFIVEYQLSKSNQAFWTSYVSFNWLLGIFAAAHAFLIARHTEVPEERRPWFSKWYGLVSIPFIYFCGFFLIRSFLYEPFQMPSQSMHPGVTRGSFLIVSKFGYGKYGTYGVDLYSTEPSSKVSRGDIVVFEYPVDTTENFIKRVVGLPGDKIVYNNKRLTINGVELPTVKAYDDDEFEIYQETNGSASYEIAISPQRPSINNEFQVPNGQYFVMGDNRDNSYDSRYWGFVPEGHVLGRVVYVF